MKQALILFTRVPVAGKTKTRLQAALTPEQCVEAHCAFLRDIVSACDAPDQWDMLIFYGAEGPCSILQKILPGHRNFFPQQGETLGEKMDNAITQTLGMGYTRCVLIGADLPQIDRTIVAKAMEQLTECDLVLGPTADGGYYLIGSKMPCPSVFEKQTYGGNSVFDAAVSAAERAGLRWAAGELLRDIDEPEDLCALAQWLEGQEQNKCPNSRRFLQTLERVQEGKEIT